MIAASRHDIHESVQSSAAPLKVFLEKETFCVTNESSERLHFQDQDFWCSAGISSHLVKLDAMAERY